MKVLVIVTPSFRYMCDNWLVRSIREVDGDVDISVVLDEDPAASGSGNFRTPGFDCSIENKMEIITRWASEEQEPFLVTDADVIYLKPLMPTLYNLLGSSDIALASSRLSDPREYNIGQMVIRPSERTARFFRSVTKALRAPDSRRDYAQHDPANQRIVNQMLRESDLSHCYLPVSYANTAILQKLNFFGFEAMDSYHATLTGPPLRNKTCIESKLELLNNISSLVKIIKGGRVAGDDICYVEEFNQEISEFLRRSPRSLFVGFSLDSLMSFDLSADNLSEIHIAVAEKSQDLKIQCEKVISELNEWLSTRNVNLYEGEASEILAWMIKEDGFWESLNAVYIETRQPRWVLASACQAWCLLCVGGLMIFKGDKNSAIALRGFLTCFHDKVEVIFSGFHTVLKKLE